jgi:para-aminobenzoate synthetase / 4-amino-4-deoxychorismate lyase
LEVPGGLGPHKWADRSLLDEAQADLPVDGLPLVVDRDGGVLEASRANIFAVRNGALLTPPTDGRILPGITRARLIEIASEAEMEIKETGLRREDLLGADEVFLTSSVRGIELVSWLDEARLIGRGEVATGLAAMLLETWTAAKVG